MEVFESIDWYPSLNDVIDDEFINVDRLENESVMYNLLCGKYTDPLEDMHKDNYHLVTQEHIDHVKKEAETKRANAEQILAQQGEGSTNPKEFVYVPGILKKPFRFPRTSRLTAEQHALCLKVILKFSRSEKPAAPTKQEINELQTYLHLKNVIAKEQDEYLEMAKNNWDGSNIGIVREDLINLKWSEKMKQLHKLHKYYNVLGTIAFTSDLDIHTNFISTILETGLIPTLHLPPVTSRYVMHEAHAMIERKYFDHTKLTEENYVYQDQKCAELAKSHDVDLVISSSGLKCLATNLSTNHSNTWILPVIVKHHNSKNIIFIDKPLPSTTRNVMEKNSWIYKYILKHHILRQNNKEKIFLDDPADDPSTDMTSPDTSESPDKKNERNAQYNIYTIGACGSSQNEMMKNKIKQDYTILVRTKIDATEELEDGVKANVKIVPKLEHQTALGAEAVTLVEAAKQWISLTFTPNTYIIRVRIDQKSALFLQTEKRTTVSINNELNRLYKTKGENILALIYNIIENMSQMSPGRYLLRHTPRDGAFMNVCVATDNPGKSCVNLECIYCEDIFRTTPNAPWPALDKMVPTPASKFFNRMPAMYYPKVIPADLQRFKAKQLLARAAMTEPKTKLSKKSTKRKRKKMGQTDASNDMNPV